MHVNSRTLQRTRNGHLLEDVQKFACRVCLKRWDLDYDSMLQLLSIPPLTFRHEYLKLTTMYNIIHGHSHFPSGLFAHSNFPYSSNRSLNFTRPFAYTNYLYHSFVPSVINPRRACAARVTVLGVCVCVCVFVCVSVCLSPLILSLQGPSRLISDTNDSSATRARKLMWRFCLNGGVREIWR